MSSTAASERTMQWVEIGLEEIESWNKRLLQFNVSLFQFPYWNEPLRLSRLTPRYLKYTNGHEPFAYVCMLSFGHFGFNLGVIRRGPVWLAAGGISNFQALKDLQGWARQNHYVFVRFTNSHDVLLERLQALPHVVRGEPLPFYRDLTEELIVDLSGDINHILSKFQPVARRNIKQAQQAGFEIVSADTTEYFRHVWPLFERLAERKSFQYRPLASYLKLVEQASQYDRVRIYAAQMHDRIVEAILVVCDNETAFYISGALDVDALGKQKTISPSCMLHWHAMRASRAAGMRYYNLGSRSGSVYQFKRKFRPREHINPDPATFVLRPVAYEVWIRCIIPLARTVWPHVRRTLAR